MNSYLAHIKYNEMPPNIIIQVRIWFKHILSVVMKSAWNFLFNNLPISNVALQNDYLNACQKLQLESEHPQQLNR